MLELLVLVGLGIVALAVGWVLVKAVAIMIELGLQLLILPFLILAFVLKLIGFAIGLLVAAVVGIPIVILVGAILALPLLLLGGLVWGGVKVVQTA